MYAVETHKQIIDTNLQVQKSTFNFMSHIMSVIIIIPV